MQYLKEEMADDRLLENAYEEDRDEDAEVREDEREEDIEDERGEEIAEERDEEIVELLLELCTTVAAEELLRLDEDREL